tara:strand:- start:194 stop:424 length:231 start_codon:yes stop_codon:yes gene_type:complete
MTRLVTVNTLAVAKRWQKQLKAEASQARNIQSKIGIWELPYQGVRAKDYGYSSNTNYVVGIITATKSVKHLGKRIG